MCHSDNPPGTPPGILQVTCQVSLQIPLQVPCSALAARLRLGPLCPSVLAGLGLGLCCSFPGMLSPGCHIRDVCSAASVSSLQSLLLQGASLVCPGLRFASLSSQSPDPVLHRHPCGNLSFISHLLALLIVSRVEVWLVGAPTEHTAGSSGGRWLRPAAGREEVGAGRGGH